VRVARGLVEEEVLDDDALHRREPGGHVPRIRVRLHDVFALDVKPLEGAIHCGIQHVRNAQARFAAEANAPDLFEHRPHAVVAHVAVAGEFVRERAHIARALDVVLAAKRVHAHARPAEVTGGHRQVRHAHHHRRTLAVFGDAQAIVNGAVAGAGI
jgi:hypothetical protein